MSKVEKLLGAGVLIAIAIAVGALLSHNGALRSGAIAPSDLAATNFTEVTASNGLAVGTSQQFQVSSAGAMTVGASGTAISRVNDGSCIIHAYATTIAASSSATVDCQAGASALTALTGVSSGDVVTAWATTSISTVYEGVSILSVNASSTNGYITMQLFNGTGGTFTWGATASSSIKYIAVH